MKPLGEILISDSAFYKKYAPEKIRSKDIQIIDKKCGYLEAPVNYLQTSLRPGCIVSFKIGDSVDETYPQIIIPLEDNIYIENLLGNRAREDYSNMGKRKIYDEDDQEEDKGR